MCPLLKDKYGNDWPTKSPYACWNCEMYFNGCPVGIPEKEYFGKYYCYGNFCWFSCASRYIYERESQSEYWRKYSLLCTLYQNAYNFDSDVKIKLAPPKELRIKYGGHLKDVEYQNAIISEQEFDLFKLPLVPIYLHISQIYNNLNISNVIETNKQRDKEREFEKDIVEKKIITIDSNDLKKSQDNLKKYINDKI